MKEKNSKNSVKENHKRVSGYKFELAVSIGAHSRKLKSFNSRLPDSTADVTPDTHSKPMGLGYVFGATPAAESASLRL